MYYVGAAQNKRQEPTVHRILKLLDKNLLYVNHEIQGDTIFLVAESKRKRARCPYCGHFSSSIHSNYERSFQDLPISDKKVVVMLKNRRFFCQNPYCIRTTFAECFDFIVSKAKKTNRLEKEIVSLALNCSSIAASVQLKRNIVNVGKSTICNLLKKRGAKH